MAMLLLPLLLLPPPLPLLIRASQLWASRLQEKGKAVKASKESSSAMCVSASSPSPLASAATAPVALTPTFAADGSRT